MTEFKFVTTMDVTSLVLVGAFLHLYVLLYIGNSIRKVAKLIKVKDFSMKPYDNSGYGDFSPKWVIN